MKRKILIMLAVIAVFCLIVYGLRDHRNNSARDLYMVIPDDSIERVNDSLVYDAEKRLSAIHP